MDVRLIPRSALRRRHNGPVALPSPSWPSRLSMLPSRVFPEGPVCSGPEPLVVLVTRLGDPVARSSASVAEEMSGIFVVSGWVVCVEDAVLELDVEVADFWLLLSLLSVPFPLFSVSSSLLLLHVPFRPSRSLEDVILETELPQFSYGAMKIVSEFKSKTTGERGMLALVSSRGGVSFV